MTRLATQAKNRLHAILHRGRIQPPEGNLFHEDQRDWWLGLELSPAKQTSLLCDLDALDFAQQQVVRIETTLKALAAEDQHVPQLVQLPGISLINALTLLGAIGDITRFPSPRNWSVTPVWEGGYTTADRPAAGEGSPKPGAEICAPPWCRLLRPLPIRIHTGKRNWNA